MLIATAFSLIIIDLQIIELSGLNGEEVDVHRDTNQRFWGELPSTAGEFTYTIKFLRSSIAFPFSVTSQVFERRDDAGVHVELGTRGSPVGGRRPSGPIVLWSRACVECRPVVRVVRHRAR